MARGLYPNDLVSYQDGHLGVVKRTHGSVESHYPVVSVQQHITKEESIDEPAFKRFIKDGMPPKGTVLVHWPPFGTSQLVKESNLTALDRSLLVGDIVKRDERDAMSGVVLNTHAKCTLRQMETVKYKQTAIIHGLLPIPWGKDDVTKDMTFAVQPPPHIEGVPASELTNTIPLVADDLIVYKNWLGRVLTLHYSIALKLSDNCVVEISEESAETVDEDLRSFDIGDIAVSKKGTLRREGKWIFGQYNPNTPPIGTVVSVRCTSVEMMWLQRRIGSYGGHEPSDVLERVELDSGGFTVYDRTRRPQTRNPSAYVSNSEPELNVGSRVRFKDLSGACVKYSDLQRIDRRDTLGYDLNVFDVILYRTEVTVQWQDLTVTREESTSLVPDTGIEDDHDVWPGEIVHTLDFSPVPNMENVEAPSKVGIVQGVNAAERMANVRWCPNACLQYVRDPEEDTSHVLISQVVKEATGDVEEVSLYDLDAPAAANVRRGDIVVMAEKRWSGAIDSGRSEDLDWLGEVVDTGLDGRLTVRLGAADTVVDIVINREDCVVAVRSDGTDDDDESDDDDDADYWIDGTPGSWSGEDMEDFGRDDIRTGPYWDEDSDDEMQATYEDENGDLMNEDEVQDPDWESDEEGDTEMKDVPAAETPPTSHESTPLQPEKPKSNAITEAPADTSVSSPPPYDIIESAVPSDHHFATTRPSESATRLKRIAREHKILRSTDNLPPGVYIRTWESRLDLLRALIIGPADTPYENAPFIIDFWMPPQFPIEPPELFFHSWVGEPGLGGIGRVNPNLYEDGKICLSLLGTWDGEKGESWNAGKSTLLQVLVSILGLVLVKEPYFNEAGYEPLAGLESSKRPSATYNERTYLRSRAFILAALRGLKAEATNKAPGVAGVEDILQWQYISPSGPLLVQKAVEHAQAILTKSETSGAQSDGLTVMSKGACIPLRRVVERLQQFAV